MICLYEKNETNFTFNGLGTLEPTECSFLPSINGVWSLKMTLPVDSEGKSNLIKNDRLIKVTDIDCIEEQTSDYQLFRIYDFRKEQNYVTVTALPVGLDARFDTFVDSLKLYNKTATAALSDINNISNKYTVSGSGYESTVKSAEFENANIISILNGDESFVTTWDGEICYDNYNLKVNHRLGTNATPLDVRYGKNITGMSYDLDASNVITRLYPKAKSGEILNAVSDYKIANDRYVDAENASDYPIPHIYYCEAPYNLVQLSDDGSHEYAKSIDLFEAVRELTSGWLRESLLEDNVVGGLLHEIELGWIINNYALTTENDGVEGIVQYLWRNVIDMSRGFNNTHNIISSAVKSLIYNAMKAGFDNVLKNTSSMWYIGTSEKDWLTGSGGPFYSYEWDTNGDYKVKASSGDYVWVYTASKWRQIDDDGYATGATDSAKWKWYKVKGKTYKRYGNKKKSRFLKDDQWWQINDVWYRFTSGGQGIKGSGLTQQFYSFFDIAEIDYGQSSKTLYELLVPVCTEGEADLFELLYSQMTVHCMYLFETDKLSYPTIKLDINMIDLSRTEEYKDFSYLERIHLGNEVRVYNPRLMPEPSTVRVIGLTYDVLRKMNTEIKIGITESSVINLLNSIGQDKETKFVAGEGITIENNVISVNPPETPYLEDVIVNGASVVRNHKAYLDLDEMGIDETIDVLYGEEAPDDEDDGEDKDFYLKLGIETANILSLDKFHNENSTEQNPIYITDFIATSRDEYSFVIHGCPDNQGHGEWCYFELDGLVEGNTYELSFKMKFNNGATFPWPYNDYVETCGTAINFARDTNEHEYSCTFTYVAEGVMLFNFPRINDNVNFTATITEMKIVGDFVANRIDEIYNKYEDKWRKYVPAVMQGATSSADGTQGSVPQPTIADREKYLRGDGTWQDAQGASAVSDLTDVELTNLADKEILEWDAVAEKWKNVPNSGGGIDGSIMNVIHFNWITASSRAVDTALTESITLDAGKYLFVIYTPYSTVSESTIGILGISINGIKLEKVIKTYVNYGNSVVEVALEQPSIVKLVAWQGASMTWDSQYLNRGGMDAILLSQISPVIYSEDEREIGVWTDGSRLYQKTVPTGGSAPSGATLRERTTQVGCDTIRYTK